MKFLPNPLPTLKTERLYLRAMHPGDAEDLFRIYGDAETMQFASDDVFPRQATVLEMLMSVERQLAEGTSIEWGMDLPSQSRLVGTCGLHSFEPDTASAEVGCMLAREVWGHGYMKEALTAVFLHAKQVLGLAELRADIDEPNLRSIRLFLSLGFQRVDTRFYVRKL